MTSIPISLNFSTSRGSFFAVLGVFDLFCFVFFFFLIIQVLNGVNVITVARFLPVILNQLFHILVVTSNEDVSLNVVRYGTSVLLGADFSRKI